MNDCINGIRVELTQEQLDVIDERINQLIQRGNDAERNAHEAQNDHETPDPDFQV